MESVDQSTREWSELWEMLEGRVQCSEPLKLMFRSYWTLSKIVFFSCFKYVTLIILFSILLELFGFFWPFLNLPCLLFCSNILWTRTAYLDKDHCSRQNRSLRLFITQNHSKVVCKQPKMNISHVGIDLKFAAPHERKQLEIYRATEITNHLHISREWSRYMIIR